MEKILFINMDDILSYTTISGNIDIYKLNPHIYNAQILYIEPILGSDLYDKIDELIDTNEIISNTSYSAYTNLVTNYITPSLVFHTMELFIPINSFDISDGGTTQHTPTNAQYSVIDDINNITRKYKIIGDKYDQKLVDYLCKNKNLFPEYISNQGLVKQSETSTPRSGWWLGSKKH